jgi:hypothetical protein
MPADAGDPRIVDRPVASAAARIIRLISMLEISQSNSSDVIGFRIGISVAPRGPLAPCAHCGACRLIDFFSALPSPLNLTFVPSLDEEPFFRRTAGKTIAVYHRFSFPFFVDNIPRR